MARFSDILYEIAAPFGAGLQKGISEEEDLRSQERGFTRLAPIRERQRAEALAGKRGEMELGEEFKVRGEERAAGRVAEEERGLADLARSMGFPLETTSMPSPERAEMEFGVTTPMERLPKAGIPLLGALARPPRAGRAMTELELAAATAQEKLGRAPKPSEIGSALTQFRGGVAGATARSREQVKAETDLADLSSAMTTVETLNTMARRLMTAKTWGEAKAQGVRLGAGAMMGWHPEASSYQRQRGAFLETVGRQLGGARGVMTEGDIQRLLALVPNFGDMSETVELNLGILNNALEAAIDSKERVIRGEIDIVQARKEVATRVKELFKDQRTFKGEPVVPGYTRVR